MEKIFELSRIQEVAVDISKLVARKKVIAFFGQMGSGKTTLIQAICKALEVKDVVSSPTFSIINEYESKAGTIFHLDLYRLNGVLEAVQAGVEDCLHSGNICFVEWPEQALSLLPENALHIRIDAINELTRRVDIEDI
ncbi:MAG: tRNA (adenosine(37)-N6)-threonylcarbamoyltransferase complex ATPase subunit type 1 TsaE [Chitinophagaceae bacterium]